MGIMRRGLNGRSANGSRTGWAIEQRREQCFSRGIALAWRRIRTLVVKRSPKADLPRGPNEAAFRRPGNGINRVGALDGIAFY